MSRYRISSRLHPNDKNRKPPGQSLGDALLDAATRPKDGTRKILLVDDNKDLLEMAEALLQDLGFEVVTAERAEEALEILRGQGDIAALLTDVVMPGMSGIELAVEARRMAPDLRIVLVSGYPNPASGEGARTVHEFHFLKKPYRINEVLQVLAKLN